MCKVFVYGTLRSNESNQHYMTKAKVIVKQCWIEGELFDTGLDYPVLLSNSQGRVYGELYEVTAADLKELDVLEEYWGPGNKDNYYDRIIKTVYTDKGLEKAYVYVLSPEKIEPTFRLSIWGDWKCDRILDRFPLLYFAYGSCLDNERFKKFGVDHLFQDIYGKGNLKGFSLRYTRQADDGGKADILETGENVEGKVYRIGKKALDYLFIREGVNKGIYRPAFLELEVAGKKTYDVLTFIVIDKNEETLPPENYFLEILRGGQGIFSQIYLEELKKHYQSLKDNLNS